MTGNYDNAAHDILQCDKSNLLDKVEISSQDISHLQ